MRYKRTKGVTLIELLIVVVIMGVMAFVAIPRMSMSTISRYKSEATAGKLSAAIRKTRNLAISNAATNQTGYTLTMAGAARITPAPAIPFLSVASRRRLASYTGFSIVDDSSSTTVETQTIDSDVTCTGASTFTFGPLGNRLTQTDSLTVSAEGKEFLISVISSTGMVKCTEQ